MTIAEAIKNRRSYYSNQFSGEEIDQTIINELLELANWAPTHKHTEPWRFRVYSGPSMHRLIVEICDHYIRETHAEQFNPAFVEKMNQRKGQLSHILAIIMKRHEQYVPEFEEIASTAMAVQNMWLGMQQYQGIGGYWSSPQIVLGRSFKEVFGLHEDEQCLGLFMLGTLRPDHIKAEGKRGEWKDKVMWVKN